MQFTDKNQVDLGLWRDRNLGGSSESLTLYSTVVTMCTTQFNVKDVRFLKHNTFLDAVLLSEGAYAGGKRCAQVSGVETWGKETIGETQT